MANFTIFRAAKIKTMGNLSASGGHTWRERDTPNAVAALTPNNTDLRPVHGASDLQAAVQSRLNLVDYQSNQPVICVEYLVTASPEAMRGKTRQAQDAYFRDALRFLEERHGADNVVAANIQRDETTPHMVVYAVPLVQTEERKRKRSVIVGTNEDGTKRRETREFVEKGSCKLSAAEFLDGPAKLSKLQTAFAKEVGEKHGLKRGLEGSRARHETVKQYYGRVNEAFEPLPEVKTKQPTAPPEPEKPSIFAGKEAKAAYETAHAKWKVEYANAEAQHKQWLVETRARTGAAVDVAQRHQAQAAEAKGLKRKLDETKESNSHYVRKAASLELKLERAEGKLALFTPEELRLAEERRQKQLAEERKQAAIVAEIAAEAARVAEIEGEYQRRVKALETLDRGTGGAAYTYARLAKAELKAVGGDDSKVHWPTVEIKACREAMREHGREPEEVIKAINEHSPSRADPSTHAEFRANVLRAAPRFKAEYAQARAARDNDNRNTLG
jgi:hypothetical protein